MKTLHLIRHAKSSWKDPLLADSERPLKKRGRRDVALVAPAAAAAGWQGQSVYCSKAVRARQTIEHWYAALKLDAGAVHYDDALYTFDYRQLLTWLATREEDELTIVGHNPALLSLIEWLTATSLEKFPTCAYCRLELELDNWRQFSRGAGLVRVLLTAKMLKSPE